MRKYSKFSLAFLLLLMAIVSILVAKWTAAMNRHKLLDSSSATLVDHHAYLISADGNVSIPFALLLSDAAGQNHRPAAIQVHSPAQERTPWQRVGTTLCDELWLTDQCTLSLEELNDILSKLDFLKRVKIHHDHPFANRLDELKEEFTSIEFQPTGITKL